MKRTLPLVFFALVACGDKPTTSTATPTGTPVGPTTSSPTGPGTGTGVATGTGSGSGTGSGTGTGTGSGTGTGATLPPCATGVVLPSAVGCTVEYTASTPPFAPYRAVVLDYDLCGQVTRVRNYDLSGTQVTIDTHLSYRPTDGKLDRITTDGDGVYGPDGTLDSETLYAYDLQDRLDNISRNVLQGTGTSCVIDHIHTDADPHADQIDDGCADWLTTFTRQPDGDPVHEDIDVGGDGSVDGTRDYTYDVNDDLETMTYANPTNGALSLTTWTWSGGLIQQLDTDNDIDGTIDSTVTYAYDANDRLVQQVSSLPAYGIATTLDLAWTCPP